MVSVVNEVTGFLDFLESWEQVDSPANKTPVSVAKSFNGKINNTGHPHDYSSPMLTKWHPQFQNLLEPGIRSLVTEIVNGFHWITFSSCEGHYHHHDNIIDNRHVSIIARHEKEHYQIFSVLENVAKLTNQHVDGEYIQILILPVTLESEQKVFKGVKVFFEKKKHATVIQYFSRLDTFTNNFVSVLNAYRREDDSG